MQTASVHVGVKAIAIDGVKAYDRVLGLSKLAALVGPVGTGKSGVLDGLAFAALGFVPRLGKREIDTARIMRGDRMHVRVELTDGTYFARTLSRDGGALRIESRASWIPASATNTAHGVAIRALFGDSDEEAAECIDLRALLDASPAALATRLEAMLAATAMRPAEAASLLRALVVARMAKVPEDRIPGRTEERDALVAGLLPTLPRSEAVVLGVAEAEARRRVLAGGAPAVIEWAKVAKLNAAAAVKSKRAARAELEDRSRTLSTSADTLADLNARRQAATDRIATLSANIKAATDVAQARAAAEAALAAARVPARDHAEVRKTIDAARADAGRWRAQAAEIVDPAAPRPPGLVVEADAAVMAAADELEAAARRLDEAAARVEAVPAPMQPALAALQETIGEESEVRRALEALTLAKADPWTRVREIADAIDEYDGPADDRTNELRALAAKHGQDVNAARERHRSALKALADVVAARKARAAENTKRSEEHAAAVGAWSKEREKAAGIRAEATAKRTEAARVRTAELARVSEANAVHVDAYRAKADERERIVAANAKRRTELLDRAAGAEADALSDEQAIAAESEALASAQARLDGIGEAIDLDVEGAKAERAVLLADLGTIDARRAEVEGADARKRELDTLAAEILTAEAEAVVYAAVEWGGQRLRERDLAARGGPILERLRMFLTGAGVAAEPYMRASKAATDFGWRVKGAERSIEALSGGEAVLFSAGLAAAVVALRAPRVRVLLVEAAELGSAEPALALLAGLKAVSDEVDNVLVATCAPIAPPIAWQTIRTGDNVGAAG